MRVFMLGWEFPPFISGGLGTACYGLTKALSAQGTDVMFVLPRPVATPFSTHVAAVGPTAGPGGPERSDTQFRMDEFERVTFRTLDAQITSPYLTPLTYLATIKEVKKETRAVAIPRVGAEPLVEKAPAAEAPSEGSVYSSNLFEEVHRYSALAAELARTELFDVVHAHDWMTFPAGLAVAAASGRPLVVHVHSTEYDRSGSNIDTRIYDIERRGMQGAMRIIAVSQMTKSTIVQHYGVDPERVEVVYNAVVGPTAASAVGGEERYNIQKEEKLVLFMGRITQQKGPEYFLQAAKKVSELMANVKFVMAGAGDMMQPAMNLANTLGLVDKVLFTGFLQKDDVDKVLKMADLYVMPSVSEPFGIASLEAMSRDVPVIISKQSGASEVLNHVLKVDFWDVNELANKIVAVLKHPPLASMLREHGALEVRKLSWADSARQCARIYEEVGETMQAGSF